MKSIHSYCQILMLFLLCAIPLQLAAGGLGQPASSELEFPFYGQSLCAATLDAVKVKSVRDNDVFQAWREYQKRDVTPAISSLQALSEQMGLNDWFVFQLVRDYVDGLLCDASPTDRVLLEHLLLVKMGYDVRLARTERQLLLLVPFDQEVYEHSFIRIGNKDYYLFFDALKADLDERSVVYPCDPSRKDVGKGRVLSLLFTDKALKVSSDENKLCDYDDGIIHVACSIDAAVIRMLRSYPLMNLQCYATSVVLPQFHDEILGQLTPQLADMSQCDAADALLHFVQYVFGYEEDIDQYGEEKINFVEESFYYDYNDCEDRSILYAFLIQSLLGLDVQFVHYPGHECTAVRFTDCNPRGNGYYYGKDYYLICDPSYVGGTIGRCMPRYRAMQPTVKTMSTMLASDGNQYPLEPRLDKHLILTDLSFETVKADTLAMQ